MTSYGFGFANSDQLERNRLVAELREVLDGLSSEDLKAWGMDCAGLFKVALVRRGINLGKLGKRVALATIDETKRAAHATVEKRFGSHLADRGTAGVKALGEFSRSGAEELRQFTKLLKAQPGEAAPILIGGILGFVAGSGGLDGDGGVPDLDLVGGIGNHRSIFTHSVIGGAALETAILGAASFTLLAYSQLPPDHHSLWDVLHTFGQRTADAAVVGGAAGVAYHLGVDSTVDGFTPYKDLPVSLPMMDHKALMGLNAIAEWMGRKKSETVSDG